MWFAGQILLSIYVNNGLLTVHGKYENTRQHVGLLTVIMRMAALLLLPVSTLRDTIDAVILMYI